MSSFLSMSDLLSRSLPEEKAAFKAELFELEAQLKKYLDKGLAPDEMALIRPVYEAAQAAGRIADTLL